MVPTVAEVGNEHDSPLLPEEIASLNELRRLAREEQCTVLLYELFTSDVVAIAQHFYKFHNMLQSFL